MINPKPPTRSAYAGQHDTQLRSLAGQPLDRQQLLIEAGGQEEDLNRDDRLSAQLNLLRPDAAQLTSEAQLMPQPKSRA